MSTRVSSVFLNVPFDLAYEPFFVALITAVVSVGRTPRCVLELPEQGRGRLARLLEHIQSCDVSVHDLSRTGVPVRFNMPFELGLACAAADTHGHTYVLLERREHRLDRTLSDMKGRDPLVYGRSRRRLIACMLDALQVESGPDPDIDLVVALAREMQVVASRAKRSRSSKTLFTRSIVRELVTSAGVLAAEAHLIRE